MKSILQAVVLAALLASMGAGNATWWVGMRAAAFLACAIFGRPTRATLVCGGLTAVASLDLALACLAFSCLRSRLMTMAGLCAAVGAVGAASLAWQRWAFPFVNRNHYAVFCELSLPLLVYAWRRTETRYYLVAAAVMVAAALAGGSRTGAALLLVEVVVLARWKHVLVSVPAAAVAASLFVLLAGGARITEPLKGDHRLEIWASSVQMIAAKPAMGWGAGEFTRIYPAYAKFDSGEFVNAAHSDWLEWGSEFGAPAAMLVLAGLCWWLRKTIHFTPSWGILVGALHATVDFPFHLPGLLVFAAALAGSIEAHGTSIQTKSANS